MKPEFRPFAGNFTQLAAMIESAWAGNAEQALQYPEPFLRSLSEHPGFQTSCAPQIHFGDELLASITSLPRSMEFNGELLNVQLYSLLTVSPAHRNAGLGTAIWAEHCHQCQAAGMDGTIGYSVEGDVWNRVVLAKAERLGIPTSKVFSIPYMAKYFRPGREELPSPSETGADTVDHFLQAAAMVPAGTNDFVRRWDLAQAEWQCFRRYGAVTATLASKGRVGVIAGYSILTAGKTSVPCVLVDDLLFGNLDESERCVLLDKFLANSLAAGAQMVVTPVLPYFSVSPLEAKGFRRTRRLLHCYYSSWSGRGPKGEVDSLYLDVF